MIILHSAIDYAVNDIYNDSTLSVKGLGGNMPNDLIRWNDLHGHFKHIYPNTVRDAVDNGLRALVKFAGHDFEIRPRKCGNDFDVYGPPAITFNGAVA